MRIVACGVGARDRGDDAFGPYVIDHLRDSSNIGKIDCGLHPENCLNKIIGMDPDLVIFFDAVGGNLGGPVLLRDEEIVEQSPVAVTTHGLSFGAMCDFLRESGVEHIFFLGLPAISYEWFSGHNRTIADRVISVLNNIDKGPTIGIIELYEALSEQIR